MNRPDESDYENETTRPVLVLFAHPALQKSRVNRRLIQGLDKIEGVTFHDLYESYPDLCIDVDKEQELLVAHEILVFHHPFFWYSTPSILKEWQDLVLEHGWAYGSKGTALLGKTCLSVVTTGGRESAYRPDGFNRHTVRQLLGPIEQSASVCGMKYLAPFIVHGTDLMTPEQMVGHAEDYYRLLIALHNNLVDLDQASNHDLPYINQDLNRVILGGDRC